MVLEDTPLHVAMLRMSLGAARPRARPTPVGQERVTAKMGSDMLLRFALCAESEATLGPVASRPVALEANVGF